MPSRGKTQPDILVGLHGPYCEGESLNSEDDLRGLDFPDEFDHLGEEWVFPVQQRLQALAATMKQADMMESQQSIIVSRYFRDLDEATYLKPVDQTNEWEKIKADPVFAHIAHDGAVSTFEELHQYKQDITLTIEDDIFGEDVHYIPKIEEENDLEILLSGQLNTRRLSIEQEERLATLGVSGVPKPVEPYVPKNARARSQSPAGGKNEQNRPLYDRYWRRQRSAERSVHCEAAMDKREARHADIAALGSEAARNTDLDLGYSPQNQRTNRKGKGSKARAKAKGKQKQDSYGPSNHRASSPSSASNQSRPVNRDSSTPARFVRPSHPAHTASRKRPREQDSSHYSPGRYRKIQAQGQESADAVYKRRR